MNAKDDSVKKLKKIQVYHDQALPRAKIYAIVKRQSRGNWYQRWQMREPQRKASIVDIATEV